MDVFRHCCPFQNSLQYELTSIIKVTRREKKNKQNSQKREFDFRMEQSNGLIEWSCKSLDHV